MSYVRSTRAERGRAAIVAAVSTGVLGYVLVSGLALGVHRTAEQALQLFQVLPEPPPPPPEKLKLNPKPDTRAEGAAAPPNIRSEPTEIVAPEPAVPPPPPPVVAAKVAGVGSDATAGSADVIGPGTGAGGEGNGRGSGGEGEGSGSGGLETPPELVRGNLRDSDYPRAAIEAGLGGTVGVRYLVWTDGRVRDCRVTHSSGSRDLDETTCRLIEERFRYRPSRDERGRPVPATIVENHSWVVERAPPEPGDAPPPQRRRRFPW
jgi:protein TonB